MGPENLARMGIQTLDLSVCSKCVLSTLPWFQENVTLSSNIIGAGLDESTWIPQEITGGKA